MERERERYWEAEREKVIYIDRPRERETDGQIDEQRDRRTDRQTEF